MTKLQEPQTPKGSAKFSGLTVFGYIPNHWKMQKLKFSSQITLGKMLCPQNMGGYFLKPYLKSKNIQWMKVDLTSVDQMWFSKNELALYRLKKGDLILSEGGEVGKTCYWDDEIDECYIQNSAHKVRFNKENEPRYFLYQFFIAGHVGHFDSIVNRVSISHLTKDKLANMKFVHPPRREQKAIATYLDQKSTQIENAIAIKQRQIALLKERKQILIQNAVSGGLNPNSPMRDSGVEWVGAIPEHWEISRSKLVFVQRKELARKDDIQLSATQSYGVIPQSEYEEKIGRRVVKIQFNLEKRKHVEINDFVISMRSFQGGLERAWASGCIRSSYVVLRPKIEVDPGYYGLLFKSRRYIEALQTTANFIRDGQDLNFENFSEVDLPIPPIKEQQAIFQHVDAELAKSDHAADLLKRQISKLKEYKATLINSAVTGKIKVPGVVEPESEASEVA